jgi:hypothetical protein
MIICDNCKENLSEEAFDEECQINKVRLNGGKKTLCDGNSIHF